MSEEILTLSLSFTGGMADGHRVDLYDVSQAMVGFQRSIALTTHLILNGKIITQSPSLKGAKIYALPAEDGSWKVNAVVVVLGGLGTVGTLSNDSPLGHLVFSLYDYVVSESLGVHVDYDKSLGVLYEEARANRQLPVIPQHQADALLEKCSNALQEIHRPIYMSGSAKEASVSALLAGQRVQLTTNFTLDTWQYIHETQTSHAPQRFKGRVRSYNSDTFKGRICLEDDVRPISFELGERARGREALGAVTASLQANALRSFSNSEGLVYFSALLRTSRNGSLKSLLIIQISDAPPDP